MYSQICESKQPTFRCGLFLCFKKNSYLFFLMEKVWMHFLIKPKYLYFLIDRSLRKKGKYNQKKTNQANMRKVKFRVFGSKLSL